MIFNRHPLTPLPKSLLALLLLTIFLSSTLRGQEQEQELPNIVLVNLDDADAELLSDRMLDSYYPNIKRIADNGVRFTNLHATTPFCAPSRACLMTGQYAFNCGVKLNDPEAFRNNGFAGGYGEFQRRGHDENELGVWMKAAGYRTMHVGKYHHHNFDFQVPPGWDDFYVTLGNRYFGTYRFTNQFLPQGGKYVPNPDDYIAKVDGDDAIRLVETHIENDDAPFFLYVAPLSPHFPAGELSNMVDVPYKNYAPQEQLDKSAPDWNEQIISDKPRHLRLSPLKEWQITRVEEEHISRVRSIKSIDDMMGRIFTMLEETGTLDNTYIMFTSDNGYQLGHHRLHNKMDPYQRTSNVPLLVMGPRIPENISADHLLAHIDLCPTILELAQADVPSSVDGKSFVSLLENPLDFNESAWQSEIMLEGWADKPVLGRFVSGAYTALRFYDSVYVSWATGDSEYYDLTNDPYQLDNEYNDLAPQFQDELKTRLSQFRQRDQIPEINILKHSGPKILTDGIFFTGLAEDDSGIDKVAVTIQSFETGMFFDGESWSDEYAQLSVEPAAAGAPITYWQLNGPIEPANNLGADYLLMMARPIDNDGNYPQTVAWQLKPIDNRPPKAWIAKSLQGHAFNRGNLFIRGSYRENFAIKEIRVAIQNSTTLQYWNGISMVDEWSYQIADFKNEAAWNLKVDLPQGDYSVSARAIDEAGNYQNRPARSWFQIQPQPVSE